MILYPKAYLQNIKEITWDYLKDNHIKGIILDVDNTLIDFNKTLIEGAKEWCDDLKVKGIKFCILSNSNKKEKVAAVAKKLEMPFLFFGMKPLKRGFKSAKKLLELENENIAVVGDQIFTDILGANRSKMHSILVEPLDEKDIWITIIKRPLENHIKKSFHKTNEKGQ